MPCIEWFNKEYGHSSTLRRNLLLYDLEKIEKDASFIPKNQIQKKYGVWRFYLSNKFSPEDAEFLAYCKHDPKVKERVRWFRSNLLAQYDGGGKTMFIKTKPWHSGRTRIQGWGIKMPTTNSFLMLRLKATNMIEF